MALAIDITIVAIIALTTFLGYKQGLIKAIVKILSFFVAIILAVSLYKPVTNIIFEKTTIDEKIETAITNKILPESTEEDQNSQDSKHIALETRYKNILKNSMEGTVKDVSVVITTKIIQFIVFILIFLVTRIVLLVVTLITDLIDKIPVINQFNKLGGTLYGLAKGLLIVFAILALIALIAPMLGTGFIESLNNSILGSIMYKHNLILMIF